MNVLKKQLAYACWYYHLSLRAHGPAAGNDLYWHPMVILNVYIYIDYICGTIMKQGKQYLSRDSF